MAEGWTRKVLCRYYANGLCREGDHCRYSHDRSISQERVLCKYFQRSTCAYGNRCRFVHSQEHINASGDQRNEDHSSGIQNLNSHTSSIQSSSSHSTSTQTSSNYNSGNSCSHTLSTPSLSSHNFSSHRSVPQTWSTGSGSSNSSSHISKHSSSENRSTSSRGVGNTSRVSSERISSRLENTNSQLSPQMGDGMSHFLSPGDDLDKACKQTAINLPASVAPSVHPKDRKDKDVNEGTCMDTILENLEQIHRDMLKIQQEVEKLKTLLSLWINRNASDSNNHSRFTVLKKQGQSTSSDSGYGEEGSIANTFRDDWVNAPVFIPGFATKSYAEAVDPMAGQVKLSSYDVDPREELCPYAMVGECRYGSSCIYIHGIVCELCGNACLHPSDESQRKKHTEECIKQHERDMEVSFAYAKSKDKSCGICMEVVMEKSPTKEQRFGILPNCCHCFCLSCIRKWRQAKHFENRIIRACPECRVTSDFICPSKFWVDQKEEKEEVINEYKKALSSKACKYFNSGQGKCPFGNKCFYLHAYRNGAKVDVGPPQRQKRTNADGNANLQSLILWDFLEERENRLLFQLGYDDFFDTMSDDSDDSDWSDYESLFD